MSRGLIIIIARQNLHLTRLAVNSALAQDYPCDILVIDNASTDNTPRYLSGKDVTFVCHTEQQSLSACWNDGLRIAWKLGHEAVLVCNNDTELRPDTFGVLQGVSYSTNSSFVTAVSVNTQEQLNLNEVGNVNWHERSKKMRPHPDFSCFMIRREVTDKVGWFDESLYPAYTEDSDYHVRMHRVGIRAVCIDLPFLHHGASTIKHADPAERKAIEKGAERNRRKFKEKYGCLPGTLEYEALFT